AAAWARARDVDLRDWLPFGDAQAQGVRQDAFDRDGLDEGDHLEVPFHSRQVESEEILLRLDSGPAPQLRERDNAVGLDVQILDGESLVLIDQPVPRPFAGAPEQVCAE